MSTNLKKLSNPFSTGSGGNNFENQVQTSFVVLMLANGFLPCLPGKEIKELRLQCRKDGFFIDDIVAFTKDINTNIEYKLLAQIKHDIAVTNFDKQFQEVITAAWTDFNNQSLFNKGKDVIVLITCLLSKTDILDTRTILDWARHSKDENEYFGKRINLSNLCSNQKREKVKVIRNALKKANENMDVSDEEVFLFLKHFFILGYDLDIKNGVTHSLLTSIINQYKSTDQVAFIWDKISSEVSSFNQAAGTITKETLSDEIIEIFRKIKIEEIPKSFLKSIVKKTTSISIDKDYEKALFIASILGNWDENSQGDKKIIDEVLNGF